MSNSEPTVWRNLAYYQDKFSNLNIRVTKKFGQAYYKPILLLSIIDLIEKQLIQENIILVSDALVDTFNKYWKLLASDSSYKGGLHYPFIHLKNEGFWNLVFKSSFDGLQPTTLNKLRLAVEYAYFEEELFALLRDPISRLELVDTLIATWFSAKQQELEEILNINSVLQDDETEETLDSLEIPESPKFYNRVSAVRYAFFRKSVVHVYGYKCAFCQLKVQRTINQSIVDGAHIKPFSIFFDNKITNGLALCKNHHWAFDRGWFCLDDNYKIIVAEDLQEESPHSRAIKEFHSETISLPPLESYFPSQEALQWHRQNIFKA